MTTPLYLPDDRRIAPKADTASTQPISKTTERFTLIFIASLLRMRIPMMPISQSDLMPISSEASNAGLSQCELVIGIRQGFLRVGAA